MTANVSDPPSSNGGLRPPAKQQFSPPAQPVSTLQHNYSNIQQPSPVLAAAISEPHLTRNGLTTSSQRPSGPNSLNGSPALVANGNSASLGVLPGAQQGGAFSRSAVRPRTPTTDETRTQRRRERVTPADDAKRSKLGGLGDLIHLEPPLNEDAVIRALQARFFNQKYYVSQSHSNRTAYKLSLLHLGDVLWLYYKYFSVLLAVRRTFKTLSDHVSA